MKNKEAIHEINEYRMQFSSLLLINFIKYLVV